VSALKNQDKAGEAEQLARRFLIVYDASSIDTWHGYTSFTIELAECLSAQGKPEEAEPLFREMVEWLEKVLEPEHPLSWRVNDALALLLFNNEQYAAAEKVIRRVLGKREVVRGLDHPETLGSVYALACTLHSQELLAEAEPLYRRAMEGDEKVLGSQHPESMDISLCLHMLLGDKMRLKNSTSEP
jgi:tetratricopeptide (TPR) repeat protein